MTFYFVGLANSGGTPSAPCTETGDFCNFFCGCWAHGSGGTATVSVDGSGNIHFTDVTVNDGGCPGRYALFHDMYIDCLPGYSDAGQFNMGFEANCVTGCGDPSNFVGVTGLISHQNCDEPLTCDEAGDFVSHTYYVVTPSSSMWIKVVITA